MNADVAEFVAWARGEQADIFDTSVTVRRKMGPGVFNPLTASYGPAPAAVVATGPDNALVRPDPDQLVTAGDQSVNVSVFVVKMAPDTDLEVGDEVTVDASAHDAGLVGQVLRVDSVTNDEWQVARKAVASVQTGRPT